MSGSRATTYARNRLCRRNSHGIWTRHSTAAGNKDSHTHMPAQGTRIQEGGSRIPERNKRTQAGGSRSQQAVHKMRTPGRRSRTPQPLLLLLQPLRPRLRPPLLPPQLSLPGRNDDGRPTNSLVAGR